MKQKRPITLMVEERRFWDDTAFEAIHDFAKRLRNVVPAAPEKALHALAIYDPETRRQVAYARRRAGMIQRQIDRRRKKS